MKTPFTAYFEEAGVRPSPRELLRHEPRYALPFVREASTVSFVAPGVEVLYRWHDAYDVFVALLEARLDRALVFPVESHLSDLHLVYQLYGSTCFEGEQARPRRAPEVTLAKDTRMEIYTPPARAIMSLHPSRPGGAYALAAVVPKSGWVTRHPADGESRMEKLIQSLKAEQSAHYYLHPSPINPAMRAWLHLLLTTPPYIGMRLDDALNGPMVRLLEEHRQEHRRQLRASDDRAFINAVRLLVRQWVARMENGNPPTVALVARAMQTTVRRIRQAHIQHFNQRFDHYVFACRVDEAKARLDHELPISAIAYQLGWSDHGNFSREFKRHTGFSPSTYRKRVRE